MSLKSIEQKPCVTCHKTGGILTCDGCQQSFCGKHVIEHRQQLTTQLENIMQEHDCIQHDVSLRSTNQSSFEQIDKWEKESIVKIRAIADKARADIRQIFESSNDRISNICRETANKLRAAREAENFSEIDLARWRQQLNELKLQIESQPILHIPKEDISAIHFIRIIESNTCNALVKHTDLLSSTIIDRLTEVNGFATIYDGGLRIKHNDSDNKFVYCRGQQLYSHHRHIIRFQIEQGTGSYNIFIGICAAEIGLRQILHNLTAVAGWFNNNEVWLHGQCNKKLKTNGQTAGDMRTNDIFQLAIDCDIKQIELYHDRTKKTQILNIDITKSPLPWRIVLALRRSGDCVKILPND